MSYIDSVDTNRRSFQDSPKSASDQGRTDQRSVARTRHNPACVSQRSWPAPRSVSVRSQRSSQRPTAFRVVPTGKHCFKACRDPDSHNRRAGGKGGIDFKALPDEGQRPECASPSQRGTRSMRHRRLQTRTGCAAQLKRLPAVQRSSCLTHAYGHFFMRSTAGVLDRVVCRFPPASKGDHDGCALHRRMACPERARLAASRLRCSSTAVFARSGWAAAASNLYRDRYAPWRLPCS